MSENIFNVKDYGAKADGITLDTEAVQNAVDACNAAEGGRVLFPKGIYVLATVFLKSNVHIELEEGTVILGALDFYAYAQQEEIDYPAYQDSSHTYFNLSMFVAKNCENISITGKAKIDMRSVWDEGGVREYNREVPDVPPAYPEVFVYGKILPAKGIYFRYIDGLTLDNVTVEAYRHDAREDFVFEHVKW